MKEVVKKEIIKGVDIEVIYLITNSEWVSIVQCVPKKGGLTIVKNENNELNSMRPIIRWQIVYGLLQVECSDEEGPL